MLRRILLLEPKNSNNKQRRCGTAQVFLCNHLHLAAGGPTFPSQMGNVVFFVEFVSEKPAERQKVPTGLPVVETGQKRRHHSLSKRRADRQTACSHVRALPGRHRPGPLMLRHRRSRRQDPRFWLSFWCFSSSLGNDRQLSAKCL